MNICSICLNRPGKKRKLSKDGNFHEAYVCDSCVASLSRRGITVEDIDDHTRGKTLPPEEGQKL